MLSHQLPVIALVSHYLTNKLIGRRPLPDRKSFTLAGLSGINPPFGGLSLSPGQVPTCYSPVRRYIARLACVRRTASVHPEPGSNSSIKVCLLPDIAGRFALKRKTLEILWIFTAFKMQYEYNTMFSRNISAYLRA